MTNSHSLSVRIKAMLALTAVVAVGCATPPASVPDVPKISISPDQRASLSALAAIHAIHYPPAPFLYRSHAEGLTLILAGPIGLLTGAMAVSDITRQGNEELADPALTVKNSFLSSLSGAIELDNLRIVGDPVKSDDLDALKRSLLEGGVIDFKTYVWELHQTPSEGLGQARIVYAVRVRVMTLEDAKVIWQQSCQIIRSDIAKVAALLENKCVLLQQEFEEAAQTCARQLVSQFLGNE